jgi:hypothetical protein
MQENVETWMALEKDGREPATTYPFWTMKPAQVNFVRITCEEAKKKDSDSAARPKPA